MGVDSGMAWWTGSGRLLSWLLPVCVGLALAGHAQADNDPADRYAAIVVDHASGDVLLGENQNNLRHPASLTKMMTVYLAFEAVRAGKVTLDTKLPVSARAAARPPSKLGLRSGMSITLDDAVMALLTKSANDAASVVAEGLAGSEDAFAKQMTEKAGVLGMKRSRFKNASGLPDIDQVTTARDMATLARRLIDDFPEYYPYFSRAEFQYAGRTIRNHNWLLGRYPGTDGLKTGYINASGYNLVASSVRGGRRLVAVVLGGKTARARDRQVMRLLDDGFASVQIARAMPELGTSMASQAATAAKPVLVASADKPRGRVTRTETVQGDARSVDSDDEDTPVRQVKARGRGKAYAVQVGGYSSEKAARTHARKVAKEVSKKLRGKPTVIASSSKGKKIFLARLLGYDQTKAQSACKAIKRQGHDCLVVRS
jgi:D-alanyl-D-alanine carboxypeptidase